MTHEKFCHSKVATRLTSNFGNENSKELDLIGGSCSFTLRFERYLISDKCKAYYI